MGISGAGKTTLGKRLIKHYRELGKQAYLIDGDDVRNFFDNDLGYSKEARMQNIKRIIFAAHVCDENDIVTVVANISPFEELRRFARKKIKGYNEIYLKRDLQVSMKNDVKGVYRDNLDKTALVGVDLAFDEPKNSDLTLEIEHYTEEQAFDAILSCLQKKYGEV